MRTLVYLSTLFFLLLFGSQQTYALNSHNIKINYSSKKYINHKKEFLSKQNQNTTSIEGTDIDFEEEITSTDNHKEGGNDFIIKKYSLLNTLFLKDFSFYISDYYCNKIKNYPSSFGFSSPIYITQGVLRI